MCVDFFFSPPRPTFGSLKTGGRGWAIWVLPPSISCVAVVAVVDKFVAVVVVILILAVVVVVKSIPF